MKIRSAFYMSFNSRPVIFIINILGDVI